MKHITAIVVALAAFAPPGFVSASDFFDMRSLEPVHGDASAGARKADVCVACHGPNGNAIIPTFPVLAGQHEAYLYWELVEYKRGARPESSMTAQARTLSDADMRDLAAYFAAQTATAAPVAAAGDSSNSLFTGEALFLHGDAQRGSPPCQGCHGAAAGGIDSERHMAWPILRGQHADYIVLRLKDYRDGKAGDSSNDMVMHGVAQTLDEASMQAIATYISALPPIAK